jgi:prepilin-type N-terminal cleavage/methylation domain-containing protein
MRVTRRPSLRDQRGFSLTELLVAVTIGMVVLFAAWAVFDRTISASGQVADRSEALQRGRLAMEVISRQLRSQVCVGDTPPIVAGSGDLSVTFYADLTDGTPANPIKKRTLSYSTATDTISESVASSTGTYPTLTFGTATTTPLLTKVDQILETNGTLRPIFRYYGYQTGTTNGTLVPLSSPLSGTDVKRVAVIKVGFRAFAVRPISKDSDSTVLENDVYTRTAVPTELQGQPECI